MIKKRNIKVFVVALGILAMMVLYLIPVPLGTELGEIPDGVLRVTITEWLYEDIPSLESEEYSFSSRDPQFDEIFALLRDTKCRYSVISLFRKDQNRTFDLVYRLHLPSGEVIRVFNDGLIYNGKTYFQLVGNSKYNFFEELDAILERDGFGH